MSAQVDPAVTGFVDDMSSSNGEPSAATSKERRLSSRYITIF